jgi:hypothetical protein
MLVLCILIEHIHNRQFFNRHRIRSFVYVFYQVPKLSWDYQSLYQSEHGLYSYNADYVTGIRTV